MALFISLECLKGISTKRLCQKVTLTNFLKLVSVTFFLVSEKLINGQFDLTLTSPLARSYNSVVIKRGD
jgi:hypothetical protein